MEEYKPGERLRVTVEGVVDHTGNQLVKLHYGHRPYSLMFASDQPDITITRLMPAEGKPKVGELWQATDGTTWFVTVGAYGDGIALTSTGRTMFGLGEVLADHGHLTRVYPTPEQTEFRERLAATPFPADDEPVTVPIGGVSPGSIVTYAEWNDGKPVNVETIRDSGELHDHVAVFWQNYENPSLGGHCIVPADTQVTPRDDL